MVLIHLNQYFARMDNPQVVFSVKQGKPKTINDAVRLTLETESYLRPSMRQTVAHIEHDDAEIVAGTVHHARDDPLKLILERMERIEAELQAVRSQTLQSRREPEANHSSAGTVAAKATRQRIVPHPRSRWMPGSRETRNPRCSESTMRG